jgi:hypothetical protein
MKASVFAVAACTLLAFTQFAAAQGTSGGNGTVASIPGSVVRGHEQGVGLFSILSGTAPPTYNPSSTQRAPGAREREAQPK